MKITNLNDRELIEYLLSSDFIEYYKPEEYVYLLKKLRNFYRVVTSRTSNNDEYFKAEIEKIKTEIEDKKRVIENLTIENKILLSENISLGKNLKRKLSLRERITGKIKRIQN